MNENLLRSQLERGDECSTEASAKNLPDAADDVLGEINCQDDGIPLPEAFEYMSSNSNVLPPATRDVVPTSQQICASQVISPDLPTFTGAPEEWPVFYSQYKNTTLACGYSDAENLVRLQRCIKGKALEYVRSRLLLPELVPKVIETLKMLYGRPTVLINSLINKVRSFPKSLAVRRCQTPSAWFD